MIVFASVVNKIYQFYTIILNYIQIIILTLVNVIFAERRITGVIFTKKSNSMQSAPLMQRVNDWVL